MSSRILRSQIGKPALRDLLISVFIAEMMNPSEELYLISPFLSNVPLIDNQLDQYTDLFPLNNSKNIYLSDILLSLVWKGSAVRVICDPDRKETQGFIHEVYDKVELRKLEPNHEKGLFTDHIYLHGSMNFTYRGMFVNLEKIQSTCKPSEVRQNLIAARGRWEEAQPI
jgi:hypothetical protein